MSALTELQITTDDQRWSATNARDSKSDGEFVYAVTTTGVYCRPTCPSRRPRRANVLFFNDGAAAELAGYRACKRCRPQDQCVKDPAITMVRAVCRFIDECAGDSPTLATISRHIGGTPFHLQRTFKRILGISPRVYAARVRLARFRSAVRESEDVTVALHEAGFESPSRLYENSARTLGMTPATYGKGGAGARIRFAITDCFLGRMLVAATASGICFVAFGDDDQQLAGELAREYPAALEIARDDRALAAWVRSAVAILEVAPPHEALPLDLRATAFQIQVWNMLSQIPTGETRTYAEIARALGNPAAARAVGRACATNPVALLIPCHRALRTDRTESGYRWGLGRKQEILNRERGRLTSAAAVLHEEMAMRGASGT